MHGQTDRDVRTSPSAAAARSPLARLVRRPGWWLIVVATAYTVTMIVTVRHLPLGSDEALYASQLSPRAPALTWSAARSRGITFVTAPVVAFTGAPTALRSYLAVVSGVALVVAYWPWLRAVRRPGTVPVAALLFAGLWTALMYGASDMPNIWIAFTAVAATGWFVRYGQRPGLGPALGVAIGVAVGALLRPSDAAWTTATLLAAILLVRRWRRLPLLAAVLGGAVVGVADWVVEAYLRYGGLTSRMHQADAQQGGLGWYPDTVGYQLRVLDGPLLCRPCDTGPLAHPHTWVTAAWWLAIPPLVVVALVVAFRRRELAGYALPAVVGAVAGLSYLVGLDYAAPRFLLPSYALLALPVASLLVALPLAVPGRPRPVVVGVLVVLFALHEAAQLGTLTDRVDRPDVPAMAAARLHQVGVRQPCLLFGVRRTQIAYRLGCDAEPFHGQRIRTDRQQVVFLTWYPNGRRFGPDWRRYELPRPPHGRRWYAFLAPTP